MKATKAQITKQVENMISALAGRRMDATQEVIIFPMKNIVVVRDRLSELFISLMPSLMKCSRSGVDL